MFLKALDMTFFGAARRLASGESASYLGGSGGMFPQEIFKIEHSEMLFPAFLETKYQFPRQGWNSLKFSLKSEIFNESGQLVGKGEGRIFSCLSIIANLFFHRILKKTSGN